MEPINKELKKVMNDGDFRSRYEAMKQQVLENPNVQQFLAANAAEVTPSIIERGLGKMYEYLTQQHDCSQCESVAACHNPINGFVPKLSINRGLIDLEYTPCQTKRMEDERRHTAQMIASMYMPKDVLKATIKDLEIDNDTRMDVLDAAVQFVNTAREKGKVPEKGFYLHGSFGVGKSFVLGAIANELATMNIKSVVVYVPEFFRELRSSINDNTLEEKLDYVKKAPVLMLDDLGAETLTEWMRDDLLGTILHYRMSEGLPTFMTSNLNYDELENHLSYTKGGDRDVVKAGRIMERVKTLTAPIYLGGKNRRNF